MDFTLPKTNIAPENGWLEYGIRVFVWDGKFSGATLVSGRVINQFVIRFHSKDLGEFGRVFPGNLIMSSQSQVILNKSFAGFKSKRTEIYPPKKKIHHLKIYFLLKNSGSSNVMLVFRGVFGLDFS